MTPGRLRIRSCIPQKQPPARIAVSGSLATMMLLRFALLISTAAPSSTRGGSGEFPSPPLLGLVPRLCRRVLHRGGRTAALGRARRRCAALDGCPHGVAVDGLVG